MVFVEKPFRCLEAFGQRIVYCQQSLAVRSGAASPLARSPCPIRRPGRAHTLTSLRFRSRQVVPYRVLASQAPLERCGHARRQGAFRHWYLHRLTAQCQPLPTERRDCEDPTSMRLTACLLFSSVRVASCIDFFCCLVGSPITGQRDARACARIDMPADHMGSVPCVQGAHLLSGLNSR